MSMEMDNLDRLAASAFDGYLVRKDLVRKYARQYPVPTYVVEFLLGRYCASTDEKRLPKGWRLSRSSFRTGPFVQAKRNCSRRGPGSKGRSS